MRKISGVAAMIRATEGVAALSIPGNFTHRRLLQAAAYSSGSHSSPKSHLFSRDVFAGHSTSSAPRGLVGTKFFSAAATASVAQEAYATETPPPNNSLPKDVVLYQYKACPFCNKVSAFLDYYGVPYKIVEVNPINKKEIKWSDYKKVPILMADSEQMVNSTDIIDRIYQKVHPLKSADSESDGDEVRKWRRWVDDHLVHVFSPNIYRTPSEALESFDYITRHGNFSFTERLVAKYAGATAMYFVSKKLKKKHNITNERRALYEAVETWMDALRGRDYLGVHEPNLADLSVFGVLRSIRYLKSGRDMVENTGIRDWYDRIEMEIERRRVSRLEAQ